MNQTNQIMHWHKRDNKAVRQPFADSIAEFPETGKIYT
jgi:hypothetical protein